MSQKPYQDLLSIVTKKVFALLVFVFVSGAYQANGQLNIKMGYTMNYGQNEVNNKLFDNYNKNNLWLSEEFKPLRFLNGIQAGIRYKQEFVGIDVYYERIFGDRGSSGINLEGVAKTNELKYAFSRFGIGLELYNKYFGVGANTYYETLSIKSQITELESDQKIVSDGNFGNKLYLIFNSIGNDRVSVSLQPYAMLPWTSSNLFNLETHLRIPSNLITYNQSNFQYGISLILYNGPQ